VYGVFSSTYSVALPIQGTEIAILKFWVQCRRTRKSGFAGLRARNIPLRIAILLNSYLMFEDMFFYSIS
jgi:hypothetical protein